MKRAFLTLVFAVVLTACAAPQSDLPAQLPTPTAAPVAPADVEPAAATEAPQPEPAEGQDQPQAIPTSRGDALVASDPAQVNLQSSRPVLVEFFRFT